MRYSAVLAAFTTVGLASAQSISDIPQCAQTCLGPAIANTGCSETDVACLCKADNLEKIVSGGTACVLSACGQDVALNQVLPAIQTLCANAGSSSGSSALSSTFSSVPTSGLTGSVTVPMVTTTSMSVTTSTSATSTAVTTSSGAAHGTGSHTTTMTTASGTGTATPVPAGAASVANMGGLAMLALGALAAF